MRPFGRRNAVWRDVAAILKLGSPLLVANLALAGMPLADTLMAGHLGAHGLAAVAVGSSFYGLCMYCGLGVMTALSPLAAHAYGSGAHAQVGQYARQGFWVMLLAALVLVAALWTVAPVLAWIGTDPSVAPVASAYVHAISLGLPALLMAHGLRCTSEGVGRTRPVMVIALAAVSVNVFLNWLLMYGHWGAPALGAVGTGFATASAQWCMAIGFVIWIRWHPGYAPYGIIGRLPRPDIARLREILALGLPIGGAMLAETALFSSAGLMIGTLGAATVAAHQIALNYASFTFMVPVSLHSATTIHVGHALGGRDRLGARRAGYAGIAVCGALMAISACILFAGHDVIAGLYTTDPQVRTVAGGLLLLAGVFQLSDGLQVGAMGALRGFQDTRLPLAITLAAYWGIGFPLAYQAGLVHGYGPVGVWWGLIAGLAVAAILLIRRYTVVSRPN
jgi:MATE family multidrug resistance protein